ncbi:MAG: tetratricopeptide repeat protein, partial [Chitinophagales bacterium]|nr:tetratricopeptide repeat protein [Chitinophagales bacterium]
NDKFLMASQADRLVQSRCYIETKKLSCITCHNPHITVKETPVAQFNKPCISCHTTPEKTCTETEAIRVMNNDNCSGCHLPKSGAIDIPHVSISDHKIQIPGREKEKADGRFLGLVCMTDSTPSALLMAQGYLTYYEAFVNDGELLDSAGTWLNKVTKKDDLYTKTQIHLLYLQNDVNGIIAASEGIKDENNLDAWTFYRIGESYYTTQQTVDAEKYFQKAVDILPFNLDFNLKLGSSKFVNKDLTGAEKIFTYIISENPKYTKAWMNLGIVQALTGNTGKAEASLLTAIKLDPDYLQARLSLTDLYIKSRQKTKAKESLLYILKYYPDNQQAKSLAEQLKAI